MTNPGTLVAAIVAKLRLIDALVDELGGEATRITSYDYRYPKETCILDAITKHDQPGVLVTWAGTGQGSVGPSQLWRHEFTLHLRSGRVSDEADVTAGIYRLFDLIANGTATGDNQKFINTEIHSSCHSMDAVPRMVITPVVVDFTGKTVDTFEIQFSLTETSDS